MTVVNIFYMLLVPLRNSKPALILSLKLRFPGESNPFKDLSKPIRSSFETRNVEVLVL